ncbi:MAG: type II secretion system F family protein [Betaproteobacteria bacterium]|jgi:general secretion pathway protein F
MKFLVRALSADNVITTLVIESTDQEGARQQVEQLGLFIASMSVQGDAVGRLLSFRSSGKSDLSLVLFCQELLALLQAGLSIVEALEALQDKEMRPSARPIYERLLTALRDGKRFSVALGEQAHLFPPLFRGMVRAAEGTSDLPGSLQRFIDYQQRIDAVRGKLTSAAIYPAILTAVGAMVTIFLVAYVVPRFAEVYKGAGRDLPWMSALLLSWGEFASQHVQSLLVALVLGLLLAMAAWRQFGATLGWTGLLGRLPGLGERVRIYELSRFYLTLGMLLEGGIALLPSMEIVGDVVSPSVRERLTKASSLIESGMPLSEAFLVNGLTTSISQRLLAVGERSGNMGAMLSKSAAFYDADISRWVDRFMRSFEPLLMAAIGIVVGVIVVLLYMPIFDLAGSL